MPSTTSVPLHKLILSPRNVRRTNRDEDIASLAESIKSKGLLQNLVVSRAPGRGDRYEVDAGGRRLSALQLLAKRGDIPANHPVPVIEVPRDDATEASLAENLQKIAMNPADEVEAFQAIIERYADNGVVDRAEQVANLARRFGRDVRYVEQRLRLAALAPEILQALREGAITLDAARAYAAVADHDLQMKVFAGQERLGADRHRVAAIRAAYAGKVYRRADRIVRYVGYDVYLAAGGRTDVDLFMGSEEEEVLLDTALVDRLAREKAEAEADRIAQEAGFLAGLYCPLTALYTLWPKAPQGFQTWVTNVAALPSGEARADAVAVLKLSEDGDRLELLDYCFARPAPAAPRQPGEPATTSGGTVARMVAAGESEIDRLARIRREKIEIDAARMAAPSVAGTPLEGRTHWPADEARLVPVRRDEEGNYVVALLVVVPKADVERRLAAAERALDQEEAERDRDAAAPAEAGGELAGQREPEAVS